MCDALVEHPECVETRAPHLPGGSKPAIFGNVSQVVRLLSEMTFMVGLLSMAGICLGQRTSVTGYGRAAGLPRPEVTCLHQDDRGVMWIGTADLGVYQFNLGRFEQSVLTPDATGYRIREIATDADGRLLILSETGLAAYDGYRLTRIAGPATRDFVANDAGVWWISSDSLCLLSRAGTLRCMAVAESPQASVLSDADQRGVRLVSGESLDHFDANLNRIRSMILPNDVIFSMGRNVRDMVWIPTRSGALLACDRDGYSRYPVDLHGIRDMISGAVGSILIGTEDGVYTLYPADTLLVPLPVNCDVHDLFFDRNDRLWIGTRDQGLLRYFGEQYHTWQLPSDIQEPILLAGPVVERSVIQSGSSEAFRLTDPEFNISIPDPGTGQLSFDGTGSLWAFTGSGLWLWRDTILIRMDSTLRWDGQNSRILDRDITGLWLIDHKSMIHYGMHGGTFPGGIRLSKQVISGPVPDDPLVDILTDAAGLTWRIGQNSIGMIDQWEYIPAQTPAFTILSVAADSSGGIWAGTRATGIMYFRSGAEEPMPVQSTYPLRTEDILFLSFSGTTLVAGTDQHLLLLYPDSARQHIHRVDVLDADAGIELSPSGPLSYATTGDGHLLILNGRRVIGIDIGRMNVAWQAPDIYVRQVSINGIAAGDTRHKTVLGPFYTQVRPLILKANENHLVFELAGNSVESERLLFQYKLSPGGDWSALSALRTVALRDLRPGTYVLEARVCDQAGHCSELQTPWRFTVARAFWQQPWVMAVLGGLLIFGLVAGGRLAKRRKLRAAELERKRLDAELNALTHEQKALQLQMNPHFIFNALQTLRSQIRDDHLDTARANLTQFAKLMRQTLDMSRSEIVSLEEELEFLRTYVHVERMSGLARIDFHVIMDAQLEPFAIRIPPMLIQPLIENAIRYGTRDGHADITLRISEETNILFIEVQDKGPGWKAPPSGHGSAALEIIQARLMKMGAGSGMTIQSEPGEGVRILLKIRMT